MADCEGSGKRPEVIFAAYAQMAECHYCKRLVNYRKHSPRYPFEVLVRHSSTPQQPDARRRAQLTSFMKATGRT